MAMPRCKIVLVDAYCICQYIEHLRLLPQRGGRQPVSFHDCMATAPSAHSGFGVRLMALFRVGKAGVERKSVKSVCPYCGVGCGIVMDVADGRIVKVTGDKNHPTNFGRLCTKGSSCHVPVTAPGRADAAYARIAAAATRVRSR
ncbi:hypothetical protein ACFSLT_20295 [Novosphingobium resinovorum]